ncbi:MAG: AAA family ATPase [Myxococcales bacterium]|nr:AAA family ATPase [Myxococcales bacterium]
MISTLKIEGLGPYDSDRTLELNARGSSTISGASEQGKTMLIDAVCFCLFGFDRSGKPLDVRSINDGAAECSVELTLSSGTVIRRVLRRKKDGGRGATVREINGTPYTTEKAFLGAMKGLGTAPKKVRQVLVPMAWQALADGEGGGRPLRDLLASILPKSSKKEIVIRLLKELGFDFQHGDPISPTDAEMVRRRCNGYRDRALGVAEGLRALSAVGKAEKVGKGASDKVAAAQSILVLSEEWDRHLSELDDWTDAEERVAMQSDEVEAWHRRNAALGERPSGDTTAADEAKAKLDGLRKEQGNHSMQVGLQTAAVEAAERGLEEAKIDRHPAAEYSDRINDAKKERGEAIGERAREPGICPHCGRDGWTGAVEAAEKRCKAAEIEDLAAGSAYAMRAEELKREREKAIDRATRALDGAKGALDERKSKADVYASDIGSAEATLSTARKGAAGVIAWIATNAALGERPPVPDSTDRPAEPTARNPSDAEAAAALVIVDGHKKALGAAEQQEKNLARVAGELDNAEKALEELEAEALRLDALVDAVRRAPSVAAREQLGALGDLGPVVVELTDKGGVNVRVDGRPWYLASTGRLVVADAFLRSGLRRAMRLGYCPLFIDQIQSVGGQDIPDFSPAILLETTDKPGITVR